MEGGFNILIKTFVVQLLIRHVEMRVVHKISIQGYLNNANGFHVFFKKSGSLINSLREKNSHGNCKVEKVDPIHKQIAQLSAKPVKLKVVGSVRGDLGRNCAHLTTSMNICTLLVLDLLNSNLPGAKANSQRGRRI